MRASARAACAPTRLRGTLSDSTFVGVGLVAFLSAFVLQYGLYHGLLREPLRKREPEQLRPAMIRWMKIAITSQVLVLGACGLYLAALSSRHGHNALWIAPAVGAAFGTALPLQFVVMAILRSVRP